MIIRGIFIVACMQYLLLLKKAHFGWFRAPIGISKVEIAALTCGDPRMSQSRSRMRLPGMEGARGRFPGSHWPGGRFRIPGFAPWSGR